MSAITTVHRAYNDVVASHYDLDPQGVIGRSLDLAVRQLQSEDLFGPARPSRWRPRYRHGDGSISWQAQGSGRRSDRAVWPRSRREHGGERTQADSGPDRGGGRCDRLRRLLSRASNSTASALTSSRDTCRCACSRPRSPAGSRPGGYWSLVGGTKAAYPRLQAKGDSKLLRWLTGIGSRKMDDTVLNPANLAGGRRHMKAHGLEAAGETFSPRSNSKTLTSSWNSAIAADGSRR